MQNKQLTEENYRDFIGHWCLWKEYNHQYQYNKIYIHAIKDGIAKITGTNDNIEYIDLSRLTSYHCIISPFDADEKVEYSKSYIKDDAPFYKSIKKKDKTNSITPWQPDDMKPWI